MAKKRVVKKASQKKRATGNSKSAARVSVRESAAAAKKTTGTPKHKGATRASQRNGSGPPQSLKSGAGSRKGNRPSKTSFAQRPSRMRSEEVELIPGAAGLPQKGMGSRAAGQSGSEQGLSDVADADSESVAELVEEGQDYEAAVVSGVERATDHDGAEVETEEAREGDILPEYEDEDG